LTKKKLIEQWILNDLSKKKDFLGDMPVCPYAAEAMLKNRVVIKICDSTNEFDFLEQALKDFSVKKSQIHIVAIPSTTQICPQEFQSFVENCRERYFTQDIWILYDHPEIKEEVEGFSFNQGSHSLFIIQKLSELVKTSRDLQSTEYYKKWPADYFSDVVKLRENYYDRFLELTQSELS
jgi:hypothetical protein